MTRGVHELSEYEKRQAQDRLMIPIGEFVALLIGAVLMLGLLFSPPTLAGAAKDVVQATAATFSGAIAQIGTLGTRMEARASERDAAAGKPKAKVKPAQAR